MRMTRGPAAMIAHTSRIGSALYLVVIAALTVVTASGLRGPELALFLVLAVALAAATQLRTRWPFLLVIIAAVTALTSTQIFLAPAVFNLGVRRNSRWNPAVLALCVGLLALVSGRDERLVSLEGLAPDEWSPLGSWVLNVIAVIGIPYVAGLAIAARRDLLDSLRARAAHAEAERTARAAEAVLLERARIASEAHDVLGHKLSLLTMQAGGLELNAGAGPEVVAHQARLIRTSARAALNDLRSIIGSLDAGESVDVDALDSGTVVNDLSSIRRLVDESVQSGATVQLRLPEAIEHRDLDRAITRATYRIVQEGLTNAHKHAPGLPVSVTLDGNPSSGILIEVRNPTPSASSSPAKSPARTASGRGIPGLRERARIVGGELTVHDDASAFALSARLPWVVTDGDGKQAES
ncbi:sensor histidine kinase [Microbacterium sp.]|uniref:sensor histidine kinase n=1 Tax=Microbacterium sp. TaxID=51671 RepID=UPI0037C754F0